MAGGKMAGKDVGLLVLRLALGGILMAHGIQKLAGAGGLKAFMEQAGNIGIPKPEILAPVGVGSAVLGGLLVILGLFAQFGAAGIAGTMLFTLYYVHLKNGFWIPTEVGQAGKAPWGYEYDLALLAMALCILFAGPGSFRLLPRKSPKPGGP